MTVLELNREQILQLKCAYLDQLADEGVIDEVLYDNAETNRECGVYMGEYVMADELIPDNMIFEHYNGICFTEDDFS